MNYKVLTHDYRPPLQGGEPLWDGTTLPYTLPAVALDASDRGCAPGYHYCDSPAGALRIARLWPDGWPACVVEVEPAADAIERGEKWRASSLTIISRLGQDEIRAAVREMSELFGAHADAMTDAQMDWYAALGRPHHDVERVEVGLREALQTMGLDWTVKRFDSARAAMDARAAWDAWAARDAWAAWAARAAGDALAWRYAALMGWVEGDPAKLTVGRIDAYRYGAAFILPTGPNELGYAMTEEAGDAAD